MTERQMRQVIEEVLTSLARKVVLPASLGVGLALSGCGDRPVPVQSDGAAQMDSGSPMRYAAPFPSADWAAPKVDSWSTASYAAPFPEPDAAVAPPGGAYGVPMEDAGTGGR